MAGSEWTFKTARELSQALLAKKISSVELTQAAIAQIEKHDDKVNAICVRDFSRALDAARAADAGNQQEGVRPLIGIPITVKESYNIAGLPTTWGYVPQKDFIAKEDAVSVTRVKAAGAVVLGKTNVPVALGDWQSYNDIYGTTNNPVRSTGRTPGGSSGGLRRRHWRPATARCRSARTSAARCAVRPTTAASTLTNRLCRW